MTSGATQAPAGNEPESRREAVDSHAGRARIARWVIGALAALMCLVAIPQPLWKAVLDAPQYHGEGALRLTAYGDRLVGDICELNDLNHYIGMRRLGEPSIPCGSVGLARGDNTVGRIAPEMALWLPSAVLAGAVMTVIATTRRKWLRVPALLFAWGLPAGVLAMTQFHLYDYGHDLDPTAAFHPEPFTPRVLGPSTIYQFSVDARPGLGLGLVVIAAALVTALPSFVDRTLAHRRVSGALRPFTGLEAGPLLIAVATVLGGFGYFLFAGIAVVAALCALGYGAYERRT